jgi:hypothetical protein
MPRHHSIPKPFTRFCLDSEVYEETGDVVRLNIDLQSDDPKKPCFVNNFLQILLEMNRSMADKRRL